MCNNACRGGCDNGRCARPVEVQANAYHACARYSNGRVYCWGSTGAMGSYYSSLFHYGDPVPMIGVMGAPVVVQSMSLAYEGGCGIDERGDVVCWGDPAGGARALSRNIAGVRDVIQLSVNNAFHRGLYFTGCAVRSDLRAFCWGNVFLTRGNAAVPSDAPPEPATQVALSNVRFIATGGDHVCALTTGGEVYCWGNNDNGQLGDGGTAPRASPARVTGLGEVVELWAGQRTTCARQRDGAVYCWGRNNEGQLGDGTTTQRLRPVEVPAWRGVTSLSLGYNVSCGVVEGEVRCTGSNSSGNLGLGSVNQVLTPTRVPGLSGQRMVHANGFITCAMGEASREVRCWGRDDSGGTGSHHEAMHTPTPVQGIGDAVALQFGQFHVAVLRRSGRVTSWAMGQGNNQGQLGGGFTGEPRPGALTTPTDAMGLNDAVAITSGWNFTCALRRGGTVQCWGEGGVGQLGNGATSDSNVPVPVTGLTDVAEISAGQYHVCARLHSGQVRCWGYNFFGQLGNGTVLTNASTPVTVVAGPSDPRPLTGAVQLSSGANHTCVRFADRSARCWGRNVDYALGTLVTTNSYVPVAVHHEPSTLTMPVYVSNAERLFCRIGEACFYFNSMGSLSSWGINSNSSSARTVSVRAGAVLIERSTYGTFAITAEGGLYTHFGGEWGLQGNGVYGRREPSFVGEGRVNPAAQSTLRVVGTRRYVSAGVHLGVPGGYAVNACAVGDDGVVDCWGYTPSGFLEPCGIDRLVRTPGAPVQL
jgi:alpha-tubulin suppressor-like RCC1 family protein